MIRFDGALCFFKEFIQKLLRIVSFQRFFSEIKAKTDSYIIHALPDPAGQVFLMVFHESQKKFAAAPGKVGFYVFHGPFCFFFNELNEGKIFQQVSKSFFPHQFSFHRFLKPPENGFPVSRNKRFKKRKMKSVPEKGFYGKPVGKTADETGLGKEVKKACQRIFTETVNSYGDYEKNG